jgi:hypothetical protein
LRLQSETVSSQALNLVMRRIIELERAVIEIPKRLRRVWMSTVQTLRRGLRGASIPALYTHNARG